MRRTAERLIRAPVPASCFHSTMPAQPSRITSRRCSTAADPSRVPAGPVAAQPRRRFGAPGEDKYMIEQLPARARRRQHQEQRRSDRQGDVLSTIRTSPIASRRATARSARTALDTAARAAERASRCRRCCCSACRSSGWMRWCADVNRAAAQADRHRASRRSTAARRSAGR